MGIFSCKETQARDEAAYQLHMAQVRHQADLAARLTKLAHAEGRKQGRADARAAAAKKKSKVATRKANHKAKSVAAKSRAAAKAARHK